jgi:hypothetical protein
MPPHDCAQCSCAMHIHGIVTTSLVTPNLDRVSLTLHTAWTHTHECSAYSIVRLSHTDLPALHQQHAHTRKTVQCAPWPISPCTFMARAPLPTTSSYTHMC